MPTIQIRLWYWTPAGAYSILCSPEDVEPTRRRLIAEGAVVWISGSSLSRQ